METKVIHKNNYGEKVVLDVQDAISLIEKVSGVKAEYVEQLLSFRDDLNTDVGLFRLATIHEPVEQYYKDTEYILRAYKCEWFDENGVKHTTLTEKPTKVRITETAKYPDGWSESEWDTKQPI